MSGRRRPWEEESIRGGREEKWTPLSLSSLSNTTTGSKVVVVVQALNRRTTRTTTRFNCPLERTNYPVMSFPPQFTSSHLDQGFKNRFQIPPTFTRNLVQPSLPF